MPNPNPNTYQLRNPNPSTYQVPNPNPNTYQVRDLRYPAWMEEGPLGKVLEGRLPHV